MANVDVTSQKITRGNGLSPTFTTVNAVDTYLLNVSGTDALVVRGDATNVRTATITVAQKVDGLTVNPPVLSIPANGLVMWGVIPQNDPYAVGGKVAVTFNGACQIALVKI